MIEKILHSGLFEETDRNEFSWRKCECCGAKAGSRITIKGFPDLEAAKANDYYEFEVCEQCIYEAHYGTE